MNKRELIDLISAIPDSVIEQHAPVALRWVDTWDDGTQDERELVYDDAEGCLLIRTRDRKTKRPQCEHKARTTWACRTSDIHG